MEEEGRPLARGPILVPTDLSECSIKACERAFDLAQRLEAPVELLHVRHLQEYLHPAAQAVVGGASAQTLRDYLLDIARTELLVFEAALGPHGTVLVGRSLLCGDPRQVIPRVAADLDARCVVMGGRGRSGLGARLIGSTAEHVVRTAPCPVLTVR